MPFLPSGGPQGLNKRLINLFLIRRPPPEPYTWKRILSAPPGVSGPPSTAPARFSPPTLLMSIAPQSTPGTAEAGALMLIRKILAVLALLFVFLLGVKGLGDGFKLLGQDLLGAFFAATTNPFIALMVGILSTTIVQSSSVTTSMVVGLVAAPENPLPIANAIPMIMGANIGTTVTNTVVSLAHMGRRDEFRRAFAVATVHDFFNFMTVTTLLIVELLTGYLQRSAQVLVSLIGEVGGVAYKSPLKSALSTAFAPFKSLAAQLLAVQQTQGIFLIVISGLMIFFALFLLVRVTRTTMQTRVEVYITRFLGGNAVLSMLVGAIVTVMVQSSSITTSLLVPLAGAGLVTLRQAFPITLGANIGTTITALLASMAASGPNAQAGLEIAIVHLLFNLTGTLLIYPVEAIRRIPMNAAQRLADLAVKSRQWALVYVIALFYVLPAAFAFADRLFR